jgi:hypothetical protein
MADESRMRATYALAQYVRTASYLRDDALENLDHAAVAERDLFIGPGGADVDVRWLRLRLWYAFVYVVLEGWESLRLKDEGVEWCIDSLRSDGELEALRRFRNAVFHVQRDPSTNKFGEVLADGPYTGMLRRIVNLQDALDRYFQAWRSETDLSIADSWSTESLFAAT